MKAVIVECSNGAAVALCDDGTFRKLKNNGYSIGQELILQQKASANRMMRKLSICASLALVLLSFAGIGSYSYVSPYSYVSLDINPSIEYALNRYDKVISVSGINKEGQQIVSSIEPDVKNQNITTAIGVTIRQLEKDNYIVEEEYNHVIVSVCSDNDTKAKAIASRVDTFSTEEVQVCAIDTMTVTKEVKNSADSLGITPGKLALIHAVAETTADSDFDMAEWTDMTVSELETTIQQASSQLSNSVSSPAAVSAINGEYLSNALDDNAAQAAQKEEIASSVSNISKEETGTNSGSAFTEQQTNTANGSDAATDSSVSKPNTTDSNTNNATTDSTANNNAAGSTANGNAAADQNSSAANNGTVSNGNNGATNSSTGNTVNGSANAAQNNSGSSSANNNNTTASNGNGAVNNNASNGSSASDNTSNTAGQDTAANSSDKNNANGDILTEDNSSKKDSYPLPDTDEIEDSLDTCEEPAHVDNSAANEEAQENQDISDTADSTDMEDVELDESSEQTDHTESDGFSTDNEASDAAFKLVFENE